MRECPECGYDRSNDAWQVFKRHRTTDDGWRSISLYWGGPVPESRWLSHGMIGIKVWSWGPFRLIRMSFDCANLRSDDLHRVLYERTGFTPAKARLGSDDE